MSASPLLKPPAPRASGARGSPPREDKKSRPILPLPHYPARGRRAARGPDVRRAGMRPSAGAAEAAETAGAG